MQIFTDFASGFIGLLLLALASVGGTATITVEPNGATTTTASASTTIELEDDGFLTGLANALFRIQLRLEDRSGRDSEDNERGRSGDEDEDADDSRQRGKSEDSNATSTRGRDDDDDDSGEFEIEIEIEDKDEDEDSDDDDRGGSGSGTSSSSGGGSSGSAGSSTTATFSMSVVGAHNTAASCYTAINGSVYDLTAWIPLHPGGQTAIKGLCGIDGTSAFSAQHGGAQKQADILAGYKIGVLAQ